MASEFDAETLTLTLNQRQVATEAFAQASQVWTDRLRRRWGAAAESKLKDLRRDQAQGQDLLSVTASMLGPSSETLSGRAEALTSGLQRGRHSLHDLLDEAVCLEDALETVLEQETSVDADDRRTVSSWARGSLHRLLSETLRQAASAEDEAGAQMAILEHSPLGIVRVDADMIVRYANQAAREITGVPSGDEWSIWDVVTDESNRETIRQQFQRRLDGFSDEYELTITRVDDGKRLPIKVAATAERDESGELTGVIAILRDIELEAAANAIHRYTGTHHEWRDLLEQVGNELAKLVEFDVFTAAIYSRDGRHAQVIYRQARRQPSEWQTRWFPVPENMQPKKLGTEITFHPDLQAIVSQPGAEELRDEPTVKHFLEHGINSFVSVPVCREGQRVATITLASTDRAGLEGAIPILESLPLEKAAHVALYYRDRQEQEFRLTLVQKISACQDLDDVAETLVRELCEHYRWSNVALFRVDESEKRFFVRAQREGTPEGYRLPEDYTVRFGEGVTGHVYATQEAVNIGNVKADPRYIESNPVTNSELCLPIRFGGRIAWLLNVESRQYKAFCEDERVALEEVVRDLEASLDRVFNHYLLEEIVSKASDAILTTDDEGNIIHGNPAAMDLLAEGSDVKDTKLQDYLANPENADTLLSEPAVHGDVPMMNRDKKPIKAWLSSVMLPEDFDRRVFFVEDLGKAQRLEELEIVRKMFFEIAATTKTPLSLLFGWLRSLEKGTTKKQAADFAKKASRQLRKIELTYDRILLHDTPDGALPENIQILDPGDLVQSALSEFPLADQDKVQVTPGENLPLVRGDAFQLTFIIQSIFAYLLRFAPTKESIELSFGIDDEAIEIKIAGLLPEMQSLDISMKGGVLRRLRLPAYLSLGEPTIEKLVQRHGGHYSREKIGDKRTRFVVRLPVETE